MDYKVACFLALMIASAVCVPYQKPAEVAKVDTEHAPKCPCAKIYFPLCGSDGKNYNNMCEFTCQARHIRKLFGTELHVAAESRCEEIK